MLEKNTQLALINLYKMQSLRKEIDERYVISLGDIIVYSNKLYTAVHSISDSINWIGLFDNDINELITPDMILADLKEKLGNDKLFIRCNEVKLDPLADTSYEGMTVYNNLVYIFDEFNTEYEGYIDYVDHNIDSIAKEWPNFKW